MWHGLVVMSMLYLIVMCELYQPDMSNDEEELISHKNIRKYQMNYKKYVEDPQLFATLNHFSFKCPHFLSKISVHITTNGSYYCLLRVTFL